MRLIKILAALSCVLFISLTAQRAAAFCCNISYKSCSVSTSSVDPHCADGQEKDGFSWDFWECVAAGVIDPLGGGSLAAYCAVVYASEPGGCHGVDHSGAAEVANGIDDNCDGAYLDDESCNGVDDDGDGRVDEGAGSCIERHLFVPVCWQGDDASFNGKATIQANFFYDRMRYNDALAPVRGRGRKFWTQIVAPSQFNWCAGNITTDTPDLDKALQELKQVMDLRDYDTVTFLTDVDASAPCVAGYTDGGGLVFARLTGYLGEFNVFTHEYGHVIGLDEEYVQVTSSVNPLNAANGCNPADCCTNPHMCTWLDGKRCLGNLVADIPSGWNWGDDLPTGLGTGRSIMSNAGAEGSDGDPTGINTERDWDLPSLAYLQTRVHRITENYGGDRRRLELNGYVDSSGHVALVSFSVEDGRTGNAQAEKGAVEVVVTKPSTNEQIERFYLYPGSSDPSITPNKYYFWHRKALAAQVNLPLRMTVKMNGTVTSQATPGGQPPVAVLPNVNQECQSPDGNWVTLDGSGSHDPDGDTIYPEWTSVVQLSNTDTFIASGRFPRGNNQVVLKARDGALGHGTTTATISIVDTTPPSIELQPTAVMSRCVSGSQAVQIPAPLATDTCSRTVNVVGRVVSTSNPAFAPGGLVNNGSAPLPVGRHTIEWTATDEAGNTTHKSQVVDVRPAIQGVTQIKLQPATKLVASSGMALADAGTIGAWIEPDSKLGDLWSLGPVELRDRVAVGSVYSAMGINLGNGVVIGGEKRSGVPAWTSPAFTLTHAFPAPIGDRRAEPDTTLTLPPGSYGSVQIAGRSTLVLSPGVYSFRSLTLESGSFVTISGPSSGRVNIAVRDNANLRGTWPVSDRVTLAYFGANELQVEVPFFGQLYVPNASCYIKSNSGGAVTARSLVFDAHVTFTCREQATVGVNCVTNTDCAYGACTNGVCQW